VFRDMGIHRAHLDVAQKRCQRLGGHALTPVCLSNPVADLRLTELFKAHDVPSHLPVEEDGLLGDGLVGQNPCPVRHERIPVSGGEGRHRVGVRVPLLLEEYGEVTGCHISQEDVFCHGAFSLNLVRPHHTVIAPRRNIAPYLRQIHPVALSRPGGRHFETKITSRARRHSTSNGRQNRPAKSGGPGGS